MSACCPVCKGPLAKPLPRMTVSAEGGDVRVSRAQGVVLLALVEAGAQGTGREDLRAALASAFPGAALPAVDTHLCRLRHKLKSLGVGIVPVAGSRGPVVRTGRGGSCGTSRYALDAPVRVVADGEGDGPGGAP